MADIIGVQIGESKLNYSKNLFIYLISFFIIGVQIGESVSIYLFNIFLYNWGSDRGKCKNLFI